MDRIILQQVVGAVAQSHSGNIVTWLAIKQLNEALGVPAKELEEKKIIQHELTNKITWDDTFPPKDMEMSEIELALIRGGLRDVLPNLDASESITLGHIAVYEKFDVELVLPEPEPALNMDELAEAIGADSVEVVD